MASIIKYAGSISQTTGTVYSSFSNLGNLKNGSDGSLATTSDVKGKSTNPNRPSTLSFTNFGFNLPTGAEVTKVIVTYRQKKGGKCSVGAPTISLLGVSGFSATGVAPSKTTLTTSTKTFTGSALTRTIVNSSSFGVKVNYPKNSGTGTGTISLAYVNIKVEYKVPSYSLNITKVTGGYNEEKYTLQCSISNKNLTSYNPTLTLTAPSGFSFESASGSGTYNRVNNRTITWNPKLSNKIGTASINMSFDVNVTYPVGTDTYTGTFTIVESLYSGTKSYTATITERPTESSEEDDTYTPVIDDDTTKSLTFNKVTVGEVVPIVNEMFDSADKVIFAFQVNSNNEIITSSYAQYTTDLTTYSRFTSGPAGNEYSGMFSRPNEPWLAFKFPNIEHLMIEVYDAVYPDDDPTREPIVLYSDYSNKSPVAKLYFDSIPIKEELTLLNYTILEPSEEEVDRLGDTITYILQCDIKHNTTDGFTRDWYNNNRIGVCNSLGENATEEGIYQNTIWSKQTGGLNDYENCEVEFTFNKDNPLYIVLTGDYSEATTYGYDIGTLQFTEPCIIEKELYTNRLPTGVYPVPIRALLGNDETATLTLMTNQSSDSVILYQLPLDEDYGTNEEYAIRGVKVEASVEQTDPIVVQAKLHKPNGEIGQRSTVLDGNSTSISIGGLGDLWGFTTLQLTQLEDWEIELSASNILTNTVSNINFNDVSITFYLEPVIHQEIEVLIEDENLAYYGAFIENVKIPEGLETDTSYLTVDGTDTNDAYRQNIREKTIEIQFNLSNCDLETSTNMLRQLAKLFTNEKDQYNRPIPKTVRFTHYPNDYFEYIMEEPFDVDTELTDYNVKAKLTIPSGTSYSLEDTVTNTVGNANGLAPLNPIIRIRPSSSNIQIKENNSEQSFQMGYTGDWNEYTVEIDCEDRIAYLVKDEDTKIDISKYVDHNSDWFRLSGEYEFEGINCTILTVRFNERW